jgi:hypothetical protein
MRSHGPRMCLIRYIRISIDGADLGRFLEPSGCSLQAVLATIWLCGNRPSRYHDNTRDQRRLQKGR